MENNTRYKLFKETIQILDNQRFNRFEEIGKIKSIYESACFLLEGLENAEFYQNSSDDFLSRLRININKPFNFQNEFVKKAYQKMESYIKSKKKPCKYNHCLSRLLKNISEYQNRYFKSKRNSEFIFSIIDGIKLSDENTKNSCFLSYAYDDRGLSFALYIYFYLHSCFLYVDWMQNEKTPNINLLKAILSSKIKNMNQFLLLRTPNSELQTIGGDRTIRQWCAWECGVAYKDKVNALNSPYSINSEGQKIRNSLYDKKEVRLFIVNFFEKAGVPSNAFVSDFLLMREVDDNGVIQPI